MGKYGFFSFKCLQTSNFFHSGGDYDDKDMEHSGHPACLHRPLEVLLLPLKAFRKPDTSYLILLLSYYTCLRLLWDVFVLLQIHLEIEYHHSAFNMDKKQ